MTARRARQHMCGCTDAVLDKCSFFLSCYPLLQHWLLSLSSVVDKRLILLKDQFDRKVQKRIVFRKACFCMHTCVYVSLFIDRFPPFFFRLRPFSCLFRFFFFHSLFSCTSTFLFQKQRKKKRAPYDMYILFHYYDYCCCFCVFCVYSFVALFLFCAHATNSDIFGSLRN